MFAIASSVGTPICVDAMTSKPAIERTFGQFARVLVDIDLTKELKYEVLVERKGYAFFVELGYENLPDFCDYCKIVGHSVHNCRKRSMRAAGKEVQKNNNVGNTKNNEVKKGKEPLIAQKQNHQWVPKEAIDLEAEKVYKLDGSKEFEINGINSDVNHGVHDIEEHGSIEKTHTSLLMMSRTMLKRTIIMKKQMTVPKHPNL